jgi:hypothetical protein
LKTPCILRFQEEAGMTMFVPAWLGLQKLKFLNNSILLSFATHTNTSNKKAAFIIVAPHPTTTY